MSHESSANSSNGLPLRLAALLGFSAVALGAFGAHGLKNVLSENGTLAIWQTAVLYHLAHAVATLVVARRQPLIPYVWTAGVVLFSGSLYILALTGTKWLGAITPFGGLLFLIGWALLFFTREGEAPSEP